MAPASTAGGPSGLGKVSKASKVSKAVSADVDNGAPTGAMAQLDIGDEQPVEVKTTASGSYTMSSTRGKGYSPSTDRYSPPFVLKGPQSLSEDPFQSASRTRSSIPSTPKSALILHKNWRSNSDSSGEESASNSVKTFQSKSTARKLNFKDQKAVTRSSGSNSYSELDPEDAQSIYPPEFCVFVANLLQSETDANLTAAVHQAFSVYGKVYIKIRRDGKQMPFAFCQYTKHDHAKTALREGAGRLICGRPCRCEMAKAERMYLFESKYGHVTPEEARKVLSKFGQLKSCYSATTLECNAFFLDEGGVLVSFKMYDMGQAAMQALRYDDEYTMKNVQGGGSSYKAHEDRTQIRTPARAYLDRVEVDNRSIFIGNLPTGVTENDIKELFSQYGAIEKITIKDSYSKFEDNQRIYFGFVQFRSGITADNIVDSASPFFLRGQKLRISHKVSDMKNHGQRAIGSSTYKSPVRRIEQRALEDSPSGHHSPGYGSTNHAPSGQVAQGYGPPGYTPSAQAAQGYGSPGYGSPGYGSPGYATQGYGPPYATPPYNSPPGYYPPNYPPQYGFGNYNYYHGQNYYPPYSTNAYQYQGAPAMDAQSPVSSDASGSPNAQFYWTAAPYSYPATQNWSPPTTSPDANLPSPECPVANSSATGNGEELEDRSATPTPSRPGPVTEQPDEVQQ